MPDDVTTELGDGTVSATGVVDASPDAVFDFIRRPSNHPEISGDASVKGMTIGPDALGAGDKFGMKMRIGLPYRVRSKVVEFEPDRKIAWCHFSGHRWRWELEPTPDGRTRVTETFDLNTAKAPWMLKAMGLPKGHTKNVEGSVRNVVAHFAKSS